MCRTLQIFTEQPQLPHCTVVIQITQLHILDTDDDFQDIFITKKKKKKQFFSNYYLAVQPPKICMVLDWNRLEIWVI